MHTGPETPVGMSKQDRRGLELSGICAIGIIALPSVPSPYQESRINGELCSGKKARTSSRVQAHP